MGEMKEFTPEVQTALAAEFDDNEVGWKPQVTTKGKNKEPITRNGVQVAGCTAHIDARAVMNRLDAVVGVGGWSDAYTVLNGKNVECTLTVFGVSKSDVGETNDGGFADAMKSAYSDALKRAAVKFGIGRYLYDMEMEWLPYDGYKITSLPGPKKQPATKPQPTRQPVTTTTNGNGHTNGNGGKLSPVIQPDEIKLSRRGDYEMHISPADKPAPSFDDLGNDDSPGTIDPDKVTLYRSRVQSNPRHTVATVCNAATMTGAYKSESHALNAAIGISADLEKGTKLTPEDALKLFDRLVRRKQEAQQLFVVTEQAGDTGYSE